MNMPNENPLEDELIFKLQVIPDKVLLVGFQGIEITCDMDIQYILFHSKCIVADGKDVCEAYSGGQQIYILVSHLQLLYSALWAKQIGQLE
jgi:hypothetical protein